MQSFGYLDVPALLGRFHREHPHVEIEMRPSAGGSQALVQELKRGGTDIAFVSLMEDPVGVSVTQLAVEELHLVGAPELLPRRRGRVELKGLSDVSFVDFPMGWGVRTAVDQAFAAAGLTRRVTFEGADGGTHLQLLRAGLGVALLPRSLLGDAHELSVRRLASPMTWRVVMALPAGRAIRAA